MQQKMNVLLLINNKTINKKLLKKNEFMVHMHLA